MPNDPMMDDEETPHEQMSETGEEGATADTNLVYLPEGFAADAKAGDPVEAVLKGKIMEKDGKLYVQAETLDDMPVAMGAKRGIKEIGDELSRKTAEFRQGQVNQRFGKYE